MKGHPVIWIPAFDHAGIATQMMVEKHLFKTKGINKSTMEKDQFLSFVWQWKNEKQNVMKSQLETLGASLDWSREYFTMSKVKYNSFNREYLKFSESKIFFHIGNFRIIISL